MGDTLTDAQNKSKNSLSEEEIQPSPKNMMQSDPSSSTPQNATMKSNKINEKIASDQVRVTKTLKNKISHLSIFKVTSPKDNTIRMVIKPKTKLSEIEHISIIDQTSNLLDYYKKTQKNNDLPASCIKLIENKVNDENTHLEKLVFENFERKVSF